MDITLMMMMMNDISKVRNALVIIDIGCVCDVGD